MERVVNKRTAYECRPFNVETLAVELEDGSVVERSMVDRVDAAAVVALDEEGYIYMVKQFRPSIEEEILEIPAGKVDAGEKPLEAALRELKEEVGLVPNNIMHLTTIYPSPGYTNERIHIYLAMGKFDKTLRHLDDGEFLSVEKVLFSSLEKDNVMNMVTDGRVTDAKSIVGITLASYSRWHNEGVEV